MLVIITEHELKSFLFRTYRYLICNKSKKSEHAIICYCYTRCYCYCVGLYKLAQAYLLNVVLTSLHKTVLFIHSLAYKDETASWEVLGIPTTRSLLTFLCRKRYNNNTVGTGPCKVM